MEQPTGTEPKPRLVGVNHVALEVGDLEAALAFYGGIFSFTLRGRAEGHAFLDMGDQFLALAETPAAAARPPDYLPEAHFGLVVDDRTRAKDFAVAAGARLIEGAFLDFLDPWGNRVEVVGYADIHFTKAAEVQAGMGLDLHKTDEARHQLAKNGCPPDTRPLPPATPSRPVNGKGEAGIDVDAGRHVYLVEPVVSPANAFLRSSTTASSACLALATTLPMPKNSWVTPG